MDIKVKPIESKVFKAYKACVEPMAINNLLAPAGYIHSTALRIERNFAFDALEDFAAKFGFKIVDRYLSYCKDVKRHIAVIEVF